MSTSLSRLEAHPGFFILSTSIVLAIFQHFTFGPPYGNYELRFQKILNPAFAENFSFLSQKLSFSQTSTLPITEGINQSSKEFTAMWNRVEQGTSREILQAFFDFLLLSQDYPACSILFQVPSTHDLRYMSPVSFMEFLNNF